MKINVYGASSIGKVRKLNEDSFSFDSSRGDKGSIFLICDGMGGHKAGEVASQYASIKIVEYFYKSAQKDILSKLNESIRIVNREIYNLSQKDSSKRGMGTTLVTTVLFDNILYFANVGDSRAYLLRNDSIRKLTKDHSWLEEKISEGILSPSEARNNPNKNIITKCVGFEPDVEPNFGSIILKGGDRLILCSDGLWNELDDSKIKEIALSNDDLKKSVERLIYAAEKNGGKDNITVVGIDYGKVKINNTKKNKDKMLLSVVSALAIFFLVFSVVMFNYYNKAKAKNDKYQNDITANSKIIEDLKKQNKDLNISKDKLQEELNSLKKQNKDLKEQLKEISKTSQINNENYTKLELYNIFHNPNDSYLDLGTVKKFFVYQNQNNFYNFLLLQDRENINKLFLLNLKNLDSNSNYNNNSTSYSPIKFIAKENGENLKIDEFIFDNYSESFYVISDKIVYKNKKEALLSSESPITVYEVRKLTKYFPENELGKYLIVGEELYYFNYDQTLNNIQFYNNANSDNGITQGALKLDNINYDITSITSIVLNFDPTNKRLYVLLKSKSENYLLAFNKKMEGFEYFNIITLDNKYGLPNKILINDIKNSGEVFIYFQNNSLDSYDEDLNLLNHYIISEPIKELAFESKDVFIYNGKLFLIDNSINIFSTDLPQ
ncbi:MAG: Stp1/IreP family PP2C-type Ser/Thr phosphatase [Deltaproteobacteria bacterium]|nr:Stp1/IreP family PP2C-type Ser/Thr phosphatase [Deltaproteobacteria bacterium]